MVKPLFTVLPFTVPLDRGLRRPFHIIIYNYISVAFYVFTLCKFAFPGASR